MEYHNMQIYHIAETIFCDKKRGHFHRIFCIFIIVFRVFIAFRFRILEPQNSNGVVVILSKTFGIFMRFSKSALIPISCNSKVKL